MPASAAVLYAVIVGVNASPSPDVPRLRYADDDAVAYARLFREAGARTTLLTSLDDDSRALHPDAHPDGPATRKALLDALAAIDAQPSEGGSDLYIVYSGHGDVDHGEGYVMLDGDRLTRTQLYDEVLARRSATRVHVIVDACKSYFLVYARGDTGQRRHHEGAFVDDKTPARLPRVGFALSTSADAESHEWEDYQGGVFSHEVQSALRGAADADGDGSVSYAELGAFIRSANQGIANPRFRPRVTLTPPHADGSDEKTAFLTWPTVEPPPALASPGTPPASLTMATPAPPMTTATTTSEAAAPTTTRTLLVDLPAFGHFSVEDQAGHRLVDANLGDTAATGETGNAGQQRRERGALHLPAGPLFVAATGADREFVVAGAAGAPTVRLSSLTPRPRRVVIRGALNQAFARLFEAPFGQASVEEYLAHPDPPPARDEGAEEEARRAHQRLRIAAGAMALSGIASGLACTFSALAVRQGAAAASQAEILVANDRIAALNATAIGLYAAGGASAIAWAILGRWPRSDRRVSAAPGPGLVGLSLSAPLP